MRKRLKSSAPRRSGNLRRSIQVKVLPTATKTKLRRFLYNGAQGPLDIYDITMAQYGWIIDNWSGSKHHNWVQKILFEVWGDGLLRRRGGRNRYGFSIMFKTTGFPT